MHADQTHYNLYPDQPALPPPEYVCCFQTGTTTNCEWHREEATDLTTAHAQRREHLRNGRLAYVYIAGIGMPEGDLGLACLQSHAYWLYERGA